MWYTYTMEYYSTIKKKQKQNNVIHNNMDGLRDCHTEWGKSDSRQISDDITYMWNIKIMVQINLFTRQKENYRYRK